MDSPRGQTPAPALPKASSLVPAGKSGLKKYHLLLALLCTLAFAAMEFVSLTEWKAGLWHLSDVGNIQYIMINTWGGNFMYSPAEGGNFFAFHFSPILFLLMPLVWLSKYPIPLVTSYHLALALTPVPLYALARQHGLHPYVGIALGAWFLGNHFVGSLQLSNHFESFYVLFALATMALMRHSSSWPFWVCAALALSVKEDCSVWLLAYAAWEWLFYRGNPIVRSRTKKLALLCLCWGALAAAVMYFSAQATATSAARYVDRMQGISFGLDTISMLFLLVLTTGGLCLLHWPSALLLLVPLPVILGNFHVTRTLQYYYSYPFLPFLALATVLGTATLVQVLKRYKPSDGAQPLIALLLVCLGLAQYPMITRTNDLRRYPHTPTARDQKRMEVAAENLPSDVPLALQYGLWGVVPWRHDTVFLDASELDDHHYVFMDTRSPYGYGPREFEHLAERLQNDLDAARRRELYNQYGFIILSPASPQMTTGSGAPR